MHGGGKIGDIRRISLFISETVRESNIFYYLIIYIIDVINPFSFIVNL